MTIAFKSQFSFIEGGHVFASNLHEKQNKTKQNKKTRKETVKRFSLRKKKTKQQQQKLQQQKPEYCRFIAVSWFRCFYDDRYSGGGVVEISNSDSVQRKTAHTLIPRWTL